MSLEKVKLSELVRTFIVSGLYDYAAVLFWIAKDGVIPLRRVYKLCYNVSRREAASFLLNLAKYGIVTICTRDGELVVMPGPAVEIDNEETEKIVESYGAMPHILGRYITATSNGEYEEYSEDEEEPILTTISLDGSNESDSANNDMRELYKRIENLEKNIKLILRKIENIEKMLKKDD